MRPFRFLTVAVLAAATVPRLAHRGMFVDGVTYAAIARNLALGRGTFWNPTYTSTLYPVFHEHPPLGFWLQSLWFRLLGDHLWVERAYSLTFALLTAWVIAALWRRMTATSMSTRSATKPQERNHLRVETPEVPRVETRDGASVNATVQARVTWLPVLLWITVPVVSWAIVGNLLETTVALFTTAAVFAAWPRTDEPAVTRAIWSVASGCCVVAAVLTKGPVGLFPLAAPCVLLARPDRRVAMQTLVLQWATVAVCGLLLWTSGPARASLTDYLRQQVIAALSGTREVSGSFTILNTLLTGVLLPMAVLGALLLIAFRRFVAPSSEEHRVALTMFVLGLAGTLPILVSSKQAGHYLVPAVPLLALAVAGVIAPSASTAFTSNRGSRSRLVSVLAVAIFLGTIAASLIPSLGRDRARLADLDRLSGSMPRGQTLGLCPASNGDWGLHAWCERLFHVSLDASGREHAWFLLTPDANGCVPSGCDQTSATGGRLQLITCRRIVRTSSQ